MLMLIYQDKKNRIHSRKNESVRTSVRVEALKPNTPNLSSLFPVENPNTQNLVSSQKN